jgi:hypothetical protein
LKYVIAKRASVSKNASLLVNTARVMKVPKINPNKTDTSDMMEPKSVRMRNSRPVAVSS